MSTYFAVVLPSVWSPSSLLLLSIARVNSNKMQGVRIPEGGYNGLLSFTFLTRLSNDKLPGGCSLWIVKSFQSQSHCSQICSMIVARSPVKRTERKKLCGGSPQQSLFCLPQERKIWAPSNNSRRTQGWAGNPKKMYLISWAENRK